MSKQRTLYQIERDRRLQRNNRDAEYQSSAMREEKIKREREVFNHIKKQNMRQRPYDTVKHQAKQESVEKESVTPTGLRKGRSRQKEERGSIINEIQGFRVSEGAQGYATIKKDYREKVANQSATKPIDVSYNSISLKQKAKTVDANWHVQQEGEDEARSKPEEQDGNIDFGDGWSYQGQYIEGLFHGYGEMLYKKQLIYSGGFQFGYFSGHGKLKYHPMFESLIDMPPILRKIEEMAHKNKQYSPKDLELEVGWTAYFGQFSKGRVTGFGELWLSTGHKIMTKWKNGALSRELCHVTMQDQSPN